MAVNQLLGCLFSIGGHDDIEDRLKEFLALASSSLLRLGQEGAREDIRNRESVYILLHQIVQVSPFLSMDLLESCFPYSLLRNSYHSVHRGVQPPLLTAWDLNCADLVKQFPQHLDIGSQSRPFVVSKRNWKFCFQFLILFPAGVLCCPPPMLCALLLIQSFIMRAEPSMITAFVRLLIFILHYVRLYKKASQNEKSETQDIFHRSCIIQFINIIWNNSTILWHAINWSCWVFFHWGPVRARHVLWVCLKRKKCFP